VKKAPKINSFVETPSGKGSVVNVNLLRGNAKVRLEDGSDTTLKTFTFDELDVLGGKGRRQEYITARAEGRLEEAGFTISPEPTTKSIYNSIKDHSASVSTGHEPVTDSTPQTTATDKKDKKDFLKKKKQFKKRRKGGFKGKK
jgi:hypothetical protein